MLLLHISPLPCQSNAHCLYVTLSLRIITVAVLVFLQVHYLIV